MKDRTANIRRHNDRLREKHCGGRIAVTSGVATKGSTFITAVDAALRQMKFDPDDDPYHEHDFGAVVIDEKTVFFKTDYYDLKGEAASPDPSDEKVTLRVMTIMLAEEY